MIFVTGDIHGGIDISKISNENFPQAKQLTRNDYVIVCGDFGLPFLPSDTWDGDQFISNKAARKNQKAYINWMKWLNERNYTLLWLDGNHDNHPFWYEQPTEEWCGGKVNVHPLAENVIHLKRGEYYTIDGHTFWVMGGAASHDKEYRTEGYSWWPEEIPSMNEMRHGVETLEAHDNNVDFILTHTMPQSLMAPVTGVAYAKEPTQTYLDHIHDTANFQYWYCGHMHIDVNDMEQRIRVLYHDVVRIA